MRRIRAVLLLAAILISGSVALADDYSDTMDLFKKAPQSGSLFANCYGYAVFPTIGKGGLGFGAAHGKGRVYQGGTYVGDTSVTQVSFGLQAGGQAYSQMIFFQDKRAFDEFTSGNFEFGAGVSAVAITAAASASATTGGATAGASVGKSDASSVSNYQHGMAVFVIIKGGAMYEASVAGQKFGYKARAAK